MGLIEELRRRWWLGLIVLLLVVLVFGGRVAGFATDVLWFDSIGYLGVLTTVLTTQVGLAVAAGTFVALLVGVDLFLARRFAPPYRIPSPQEEAVERYRDALDPIARPVLLSVAVLVGLLASLTVVGEWDTVLLWANAQEFGRADPQFGRDLGFFVFRLPLYLFLNSWLFTILALAIALTALAHYVFGGIRPQAPGQRVTAAANVHLSVLLALLVAVRAWGFWLDRYELSFDRTRVLTGLGYTSATARLPALTLLTVIAAVCVVLFLLNVRARNFLLPVAGVGILLVAALVLVGIYPAVIQRFQVTPQERERERPYIAEHLALTNFGYGLEGVEVAPFEPSAELTAAQASENTATLESIRLWDPPVLEPVYSQLQGLRQFFDFADIDVDRYALDGTVEEVNLAVRGLDVTELPSDSWQNQHLEYTHGYGIVASDVSDSIGTGQPRFLVSDIPLAGAPELLLERPQIYFGESLPDYSIVGTEQGELDFVGAEAGEERQGFRYDGADGVRLGSLLRRLAFAVRYREPNIVLSGLLTPESRLIQRRELTDRVGAVAPFLQLDGDPYPVVVEGGVRWVIDAYTTSDMLPYSVRQDLGRLTEVQRTRLVQGTGDDGSQTLVERQALESGLEGTANYVRNSVKAVVDAYDGTVTLYVIDQEDPVLAAWRQVFPDSFTDVDQAPDELVAHFRYPEDLLRVQAAIYAPYHVGDPDTFYSSEDAWQIPADAAAVANDSRVADNPPPLRPSYLQLRLPEEDTEEFVLVQPFSPRNRPNLIAYLAARSDPGVYGQLRAYQLPASRSVPGPEQVQSRIRADRAVARETTLLGQQGSLVRYGNLLTIPVADSLLYVQPLFVEAENAAIPELRFVVLVQGERVVAEETLGEALTALFGERVDVGEPVDPDAPAVDPGTGVDADLVDQAVQAFEDADEALADGDLGAYQEAIQQARDLLEQLQGEAAPASPAPSPSPPG